MSTLSEAQFETLELSESEGVLSLTLRRGRSNPMNATLVKELCEVFGQAEQQSEIRGVILQGQPGFFSVGLDVVELYDYEPERFEQFWHELAAMILAMMSCSKPVVAVITGHAPAGGCVLALCCDYRIMAQGAYQIGLNELPVGIVIPPLIYELYRFVLGENLAYKLLMEGRLMTADAALNLGLVDEAVAPEQVWERAQKQMQIYLQINPSAWSQSKKLLRRELLQRMQAQLADFDRHFAPVIEHWWRPESRQQLQQMIQRLKKV